MAVAGEQNSELSPVKRALLEVRALRSRLEALEESRRQPLAITGMGLRFPGGAHDPESFWKLLSQGVDAVGEVPPERWDVERFYHPDPEVPGKMSTRWGGFLESVDGFDPHFFGIAPREAESLDPQQRLLLEVAWEALENAGISPESLHGSRTGVFVGICNSDYQRLLMQDPEQIDTYTTTGNALSVAAGRLSYFLGLQGPNLALDTACSASLVAVHLAVESLRRGECDLALVGGVNLILTPELTINFSQARMMAADGRCKTFDAAADGYVRGEGCGMLVLKRLADARAGGDRILALVRGSAVNHDGRSGGLTAPNGPSQEAVIAAALEDAGVEPESIGYLEAHGTGTALGDPIEVQAAAAALCRGRSAERPLLAGSVKTNIGHLEGAAGVAGLIKTVLALQHGAIPPHLHLQRLNPHLSLEGVPFAVPTTLTPWDSEGGPRRAGVSSFGLSGTNAHVILEEAPPAPEPEPAAERPVHLLCLSARSQAALEALAARYQAYLERPEPEGAFGEVCFTSGAGRAHFEHRLALVASSAGEASRLLAEGRQGEAPDGVFAGHAPSGTQPEVAFLFSGHGGNWAGMGRGLFETQPAFRADLERCDALLREGQDLPLLPVLFPELYPESRTGGGSLESMSAGLPALFSLQYALCNLWRSWGVEPALMLGHSAGEYAAACAAGVLSLEDALRMVASRGRLMESIDRQGEMWTVFAGAEQVEAVLQPYAASVSVAAVNGPHTTVISGESGALEAALEDLRRERLKARRLPVSQAAHSPLVEPLQPEFARIAASIAYAPPQTGLVSCMTGELARPEEITRPEYWSGHLRRPVQFYKAMRTLNENGQRVFLEIGPSPMLLALGERCLPGAQAAWLASLRQGRDDWQQLLESLARLYTLGAPVRWEAFYAGASARRLSLPTYPFQRSRYWHPLAEPGRAARAAQAPARREAAWGAAESAARRQSLQGPLDLDLAAYPEKWAALEGLARAYILNALVGLGIFSRAGETCSPDELLGAYGLQPVYRGLLSLWLGRLAQAGLLERREGAFHAPRPLPQEDLPAALEAARACFRDFPALPGYMERCGSRLREILTGQDSPLETLFPGGSLELAEALYQHWSLSRYYGSLAGAAASAFCGEAARGLAPGERLRVLEVGAGTGATTAALLPALPAGQVQYTFTDVSELFLGRAEEKFAVFEGLEYRLLDIERDPAGQGFPARAYDLVVAANVLHATADLRAVLRHVQSLLAPGGLLLLQEATTYLPWFDVTTGLIEGWQRFQDGLRGEHPLLPAQQWQALLQEAGFGPVAALPEAGSPPAILGQALLLAQAPGSPGAGRWQGLDGAAGRDEASRRAEPDAAAQGAAQPESLSARLQEALPDERRELLLDFVRRQAARVLRLPAGFPLPPTGRLVELGLDSLMALELRRRLARGLELGEEALPATLVFDYPTPEAIAAFLQACLFPAQAEGAPGGGLSQGDEGEASLQARRDEVAGMSDEEVEALLLKRLEGGRRGNG